MPVVAQILIPVRFKDDGIVEILRKEINQCGCIDLVTESKKTGTPVDRLLEAMSRIDGVVCNDSGFCCSTDVAGFADKLHRLTRGNI